MIDAQFFKIDLQVRRGEGSKPTFFKIFGDFGILLKRQFAIVKPFINRFPKFFLYCVQIDHYIGINFMILRCWKNDVCRHFMIFGVFFAIFLFLPYYDQGWKKYFFPMHLCKISREYRLLIATFIVIISIDSNDSMLAITKTDVYSLKIIETEYYQQVNN